MYNFAEIKRNRKYTHFGILPPFFLYLLQNYTKKISYCWFWVIFSKIHKEDDSLNIPLKLLPSHYNINSNNLWKSMGKKRRSCVEAASPFLITKCTMKLLFLYRHFLYDALALVFHAIVIHTSSQMLDIEFHGMRTGSGRYVLAMEYLSRNRC